MTTDVRAAMLCGVLAVILIQVPGMPSTDSAPTVIAASPEMICMVASSGAICSANPLPAANENKIALIFELSSSTTLCLPDTGMVSSCVSCLMR